MALPLEPQRHKSQESWRYRSMFFREARVASKKQRRRGQRRRRTRPSARNTPLTPIGRRRAYWYLLDERSKHLWVPHGFSWVFYGFLIGFSWVSHGFLVGFSLVSHWFPCVSYDFYMGSYAFIALTPHSYLHTHTFQLYMNLV